MTRMATDFRDGTTFPRRGRTALGGALWLARMFDKARAARSGTIFDYIYPCPMDLGVMQRWGITDGEFEAAIARHQSDEAILSWLQSRTSRKQIEDANRWLLEEKAGSLNRQDTEEGAVNAG